MKPKILKMKKKYLVPGGVLALVVMFMYVITIFTGQVAALGTVGSSSNQFATKSSNQRKVFYDDVNSVYWAFWYNGVNLEYANSPDGGTWTSRGTISGTSDTSVWYVPGTTTVYKYAFPSSIAEITKGTIGPTSISWASGAAIASVSSSASVSRDTNSKLWYFAKGTTTVRASRSTNADDISALDAATVVDTQGTNLTLNEATVVPLSGGDMYFIWASLGGTNSDYTIYGKKYTNSGSSFGGRDTIASLTACTSATANTHHISATSMGNEVYLAVQDGANGSCASGAIKFYTYSSGAWSGATTVESTTTNSSPAISLDSRGDGTLGIFYIRSNTIYYRKAVSPFTSWGNETTLYSTGTNTNLSTSFSDANGYAQVMWANGTANPWSIKFDRVLLNTAPSTPTLTSPADGSHPGPTTPTLNYTDTDPDSNDIRYNVQIDTVNSFDSQGAYVPPVAGGTSSYYFDASDAAISDPNSVWTNDANAFDGNTATDTKSSANGTTASNFLLGEGTTAPTSGGSITQVRARIYTGSAIGVANEKATIYTNSLAESLGEVVGPIAGTGYGSYLTLTTPTGGWTWAKVNNLEAKIYRAQSDASGGAFRVEVEVTYGDTAETPAIPLLDKTSGTDAGFSGTADSSDPFSSSNTDNSYTLQSALTRGVTYYWRVRAIDPTGTNTYSSWSDTRAFTINLPPSTPTLIQAGSGATQISVNPVFRLGSTDADSDYLRYAIKVYTAQANCNADTDAVPDNTNLVRSIDQTSSQTGWSAQDASSNTAYLSAPSSYSLAIHTYQNAPLTPNTDYWWKGKAKDPTPGTDTWSAWSACQVFTTGPKEVRIQGGVEIRGGTTIQ